MNREDIFLGKAKNDLLGGKKVTQKFIHLLIQQRNNKKCLTLVKGIPEDIDLKKVLKAWKKVYNCNGSIKKDDETNEEYIQLFGDHRDEVSTFLIHEGIGTEETVKIHGTDL